MVFSVNFHTCNLGTKVKRFRNFFAGLPLNAFDDPGLSPAERTAVVRFLQNRGAVGPDEFGVYSLTLGDGGEVEIFASGLAGGGKFVAGTVQIRKLTCGVADFLFEVGEVGNVVLSPEAAAACPLVTSAQMQQEIASRFPGVKVVPSPSALETELRCVFDAWQQHEHIVDKQPRRKRESPAVRPLVRLHTAFEENLSAFFGAVIALCAIIMIGLLLLLSTDGAPWELAVGGLLFLVCLLGEGWFLTTVWRVLKSKTPLFAVAVAMQQPRLPYLFRPIAALFWTNHFWLGLIFGVLLPVVNKQIPFAGVVVLALIATTFSYLTFVYLLLLVTVFTKRLSVLRRIWPWRGWWAVLHGVFVVAAHFMVA